VQILDKVGEGGFADIYKAIYRGQLCALKQWRQKDLPPEQLQLFQREVQIGGLICHPNCVTLHAVCLQPICLLMEFVDGCDLYDLIHDPSVTLTVLFLIYCDSLICCHSGASLGKWRLILLKECNIFIRNQ